MTTNNNTPFIRSTTLHWELNNRSDAYDYRHLSPEDANYLIAIDLQEELRYAESQLAQAQENVRRAEEKLAKLFLDQN